MNELCDCGELFNPEETDGERCNKCILTKILKDKDNERQFTIFTRNTRSYR